MNEELTIKQKREIREFNTLFKNPKHARQMWAETVFDRFSKPAIKPILIYDKDDNLSQQSQIEQHIWAQLTDDLKLSGFDRPITDGEFMEACQAYYSRHNAASYTARRDTMGAKPIDESKQTHAINNPYEELSDEELMLIEQTLQKHRNELTTSEEQSCISVGEGK